MTQERFEKEVVPLVTVSKLNHFEIGECVITRANTDAVLWSRLERYYLCPELQFENADANEYNKDIDFSDKKYLFSRIIHSDND